MKFNLPNDQKKQAYENVRNELEKKLILRLTAIGIDPEDFDEESFEPNPSSTAQMNIKDILEQIARTKAIIAEL